MTLRFNEINGIYILFTVLLQKKNNDTCITNKVISDEKYFKKNLYSFDLCNRIYS